jgi:hypothetical protein
MARTSAEIVALESATRVRRKSDGLAFEVIARNAAIESRAYPQLQEMFELDTFIVLRSERTSMHYVIPSDEFIGSEDYEPINFPPNGD